MTLKYDFCWQILLLLIPGLFYQGQAQVSFTSSNLPIVIIDTHGQAIPYDDPRIMADMDILYKGGGQRNFITDAPNNYSGKISIEIHGQSSAGWDKKSYGLETENSDGSNRNVSLLDLPEENDWILYAPYYDRSLMRNVLMYRLARHMGLYASRTRYCELVLNGEYKGLYVLMEKIKRDKNRVNINKLKADEVSGDDVTGGYILRIDKEPWNPGFDSPYLPFPNASHGIRYQYRYPKPDDIAVEQETYIKGYVYSFENMMHDSTYSDTLHGYVKYLNVPSFVDNVLLNELSRNVDGYRLSAYFYKDKDSKGGKLTAGPIWDYNFSFGNVGYYDSWKIEGWQLLYFADNEYFHQVDDFFLPFWWKLLFKDKYFAGKLKTRWQNLRQTIFSQDSIFALIDMFADSIAEARQRNFQIWPAPGETDLGGGWFPDDPRSSEIHSYDDEIFQLKDWIVRRMNWIDENIGKITAVENHRHGTTALNYTLEQNYPNPFGPGSAVSGGSLQEKGTTVIRYTLRKNVRLRLTIYNVLGQVVREAVHGRQGPGTYQIRFNGRGLPGGIYFYRLQISSGPQWVRKMVFLSE